jgi:DNA adenine methylase
VTPLLPADPAGSKILRAPFPWFGGKSRVAHVVWDRFGDVPNYVEPFAGSLAVLLARPTPPGTETVNDTDCYLANFWRALQSDPVAVASYAAWPVNEADLHARHKWLVGQQPNLSLCMRSDPNFYDVIVAGWWAWGICQWIGSGWCPAPRDRGHGAPSEQLPHLGTAGMGLHRKLPHLGDAGRGMLSWLCDLSARLRHVRVACGDWTRIMGPSVTERHGVTGVFLDPPYSDEEHAVEYAGGGDVAHAVREWAAANGGNPLLRIALCGYEGEHDALEAAGWAVLAWKAKGGYGSQGAGRGRENAGRERIWFSPACLNTRGIAGPLFAQEQPGA